MVIFTGGLLLIVLGTIGKFGALFVTLPDPVIGGVFMVTFGKTANTVERQGVREIRPASLFGIRKKFNT